MHTKLTPEMTDNALAQEASDIISQCVHCGFCLATCPTYEILGNEADSPRGRIYLIKEMLEGAEVTAITQKHLDNCLSCRNCETTCPSGVAFGQLIDIGRYLVDARVERDGNEARKRKYLRKLLTSEWFEPAYRLGQRLRYWLPPGLQTKVLPERAHLPQQQGGAKPRERVLMLAGCTQPAMMPQVDQATIQVLERLDIEAITVVESGCCGALDFHLDAQERARSRMRTNIDAWWPLLDSGEVSAIVMNASGCGAMVREYGHHLRMDPAYAEKAREVSARVRDIGEFLAEHQEALLPLVDVTRLPDTVAFQIPCSLQHWQRLGPKTEGLLRALGMNLVAFDEPHLCCGAAGAYSVLNPKISGQLRDRKLERIEAAEPVTIVSANVGCIGHLQAGTATPVRHWIEVLASAIRS